MPAPVDINDPFRALSDPTRREIVALLAAGALPVRLIAAHFPRISRPAVSKHLRILREGALVTEERSGRERYYSLELAVVEETLEWMESVHRQAVGQAGGNVAAVREQPAKRKAAVVPRPRRPSRGEVASAPAPSLAPAPARTRRPRRKKTGPPKPQTPPLESNDWKAW